MQQLTISGLAKEGGVGVETIRFYQRRGLLHEPERSASTHSGRIRRYGRQDVRRLRFVRAAQAAGFTLEEIRELLALDSTHERAKARQIAEERIAALDEKIAALKSARSDLLSLARACAEDGGGPCPIIQAFQLEE